MRQNMQNIRFKFRDYFCTLDEHDVDPNVKTKDLEKQEMADG